MSGDMVTVRMPGAHWRQLVSDYESMCGVGSEEIEILQEVEVLDLDEIKDDAVREYRFG